MIQFICIISILAGVDFFCFFILKRRVFGPLFTRIIECLVVIGMTWLFLFVTDLGLDNDCCNSSALFSPEHKITAYFWIISCTIAFLYSAFRKTIAPPLIEVLVNCFLILGIVFNIFVWFQVDIIFGLIGNAPIILLFVLTLVENQLKVIQYAEAESYATENVYTRVSYKILTSASFIRYPLLILVCLPVIIIVTAVLLLFGQKADSSIRAFTDTYKHGLSQLDYMCDNVYCGGHYLCSVAANGHENVVKPVRLGVRNKGTIVCNRQLLISNAFEELIEDKTPRLHQFIRRNYNRVGDVIHKYYSVFENKYLSDFIYILMKPLELIFWLVLYSTERNPENRIAQQYLSQQERLALRAAKK